MIMKSKSHTATKAVSVLLLLLLTACGTIGQKTVTHSALARRAAFALNADVNEIDITNRYTDGMYRINFTVLREGKNYQCHVAMSAGVLSDAMCISGDGSINGVPLWINTPPKSQHASSQAMTISPELLQWLESKIQCVEPAVLTIEP